MKSSKKNFFYQAFYQVLILMIPLFTTPFLTRTMGIEALGEYSFYYSIAYYFVIVIKLGLDNYGNRQIAKIREEKEQLSQNFWGIYYFQLFIGIVISAIYILLIFLDSDDLWIKISMIPLLLSSVIDITWFFYGLEEFKITVLRNTLIKLGTTVLIFLLIKSDYDLLLYSFLLSLSNFFSQLYLWFFLSKRVTFKLPHEVKILHHIKPNLILFLPVLAVSIYKIMAKILLGYMTTATQVGYFDSSDKVIQIPLALVTSLGTVMMPRMSNLYAKESLKDADRVFSQSIEIAMFLSTALGFGLMGVAKTFVPWYYGENFGVVIILFQILLPSSIFLAFANVIRTQYLIPNSRDKVYITTLFLGAIVNLLANILLIPQYAAIGAAIATLIAEVVVCLSQAYSIRKEIPIVKYFQLALKYVVSGFIMYIVVVQVDFLKLSPIFSLAIQILIGFFIYMLSLFLFLNQQKRSILVKRILKVIKYGRKNDRFN
ncbi:oligosaccharide flippase family protein [Streptococcus suis]|uniref:Transporter n=1 Tax=Streptococcus suis TaxID=1307 RepID=A0A0Z8EIR4_STRSU|nr:oligosaccharide flippase family protein [Streptococcus suis]NQH63239.1 oligosaccharide flippase family protein [Streptococcus suis]NQH67345.1 oligosaccharide flippase family protein [Streptococcus suis]QRA07956.1 polysaccharide biosynthesis C-terminal domain-containing protein [Streptococcus suis]QWS31782.1 polysaccharide biosynthesis C-terminal domain-containing protein [Streptococcus suis]UAJ08181.1 oligosaccharide flippase family protein [Streptococcus suis]